MAWFELFLSVLYFVLMVELYVVMLCFGSLQSAWQHEEVTSVVVCEKAGKDVQMFAMRLSGVVGMWGSKRWFCKLLCATMEGPLS